MSSRMVGETQKRFLIGKPDVWIATRDLQGRLLGMSKQFPMICRYLPGSVGASYLVLVFPDEGGAFGSRLELHREPDPGRSTPGL